MVLFCRVPAEARPEVKELSQSTNLVIQSTRFWTTNDFCNVMIDASGGRYSLEEAVKNRVHRPKPVSGKPPVQDGRIHLVQAQIPEKWKRRQKDTPQFLLINPTVRSQPPHGVYSRTPGSERKKTLFFWKMKYLPSFIIPFLLHSGRSFTVGYQYFVALTRHAFIHRSTYDSWCQDCDESDEFG